MNFKIFYKDFKDRRTEQTGQTFGTCDHIMANFDGHLKCALVETK